MSIPLYEDFDDALGMFSDYDTYDINQCIALGSQNHVDIRSFEGTITVPFIQYELDVIYMGGMNLKTMQVIEQGNTIQTGENWTAGVIGPQADRDNMHGLSLSCSIGTNSTSSVIKDAINVDVVSLLGTIPATVPYSGLEPSAGTFPSRGSFPTNISLALPAFPLANLNLSQCFIDFTSNPTGDFSAGPTDSLAFSTSAVTLVAGDSEASFMVSSLTNTNINAITGVRFRIQATGTCTFRCLAIRCFSGSWVYAPVDKNTLYHRLEATVPLNGALPGGYQFPSATTDWPILFFGDPLESEPTPIDMEVGTVIHTGTGSFLNTYQLYLRESPLLLNTQTNINGRSMNAMEGVGEQPDTIYASGAVGPVTMYNIDNHPMSEVDLDDMGYLETAHRVATRFIVVSFQWGTSNSLHIKDELGYGYDFTGIGVSPTSDYYLLVTLENHSIRARIYPLTPEGYILWGSIVFDSTAIIDSSFVYRRPGRFGWYAHLGDGDTYVKALRPRYITHNEYRSLPMATETPTEGAQLFVGATPEIDLYPGAIATPGATLTADLTKSTSGHSLRITCDGLNPLEGLISVPMRFENLIETYASFDFLATAGATFEVLLVGEFRYLLLEAFSVQNNNWQHIEISMDQIGHTYQPGEYSFTLVQINNPQNVWYIDNLAIFTRSVAWAGRQAADPWLMRNPKWTPFGTTINQPHDGIIFDRGQQMQIRGRGLTQEATISDIKTLPKYAQLGNFAWADQAKTSLGPPVASFGFSGLTTVSCDGRASGAPNGIAAYLWSFGDGSFGYGPQVIHTYLTTGVYTITLTVIDNLNLKASQSQIVSNRPTGIISLPLAFTK